MTNISLYKLKPTTQILNKLSKIITSLGGNNTKRNNAMAKSMIKELKSRELTQLQKQQFKRLFDRYTWI
jgi:hypothetical protein